MLVKKYSGQSTVIITEAFKAGINCNLVSVKAELYGIKTRHVTSNTESQINVHILIEYLYVDLAFCIRLLKTDSQRMSH